MAQKKPPLFGIGFVAEALARIKGRAQATPEVNPFKAIAKLHPPAVTAGVDTARLALDSSLESAGEWAAVAFASAAHEGIAFMGYPFLAELAQRPEYRRAVEIIALNMTRKWIKLKCTGDDPKAKSEKIKQLTAVMEKLDVRRAFRKVAEQDGFFGRAHLYLDFGAEVEKDLDELKTTIGDGSDAASKGKIGKERPLVGLKTVEAVWCYPSRYVADNPLSAAWYNPQTWFVMGKEVHATRLLRFVGREVPDLLKPAYSFGGLALTQLGKPYVDNWLRTRQSVADIISVFSVFVLKTRMVDQINADPESFFRRLDLFTLTRDNRGVLAIDKDLEDFENIAAPLGTLDALQAQTQEHMAAVWGIPLVVLLGIQPAGLNASSEGELKVWREWINAYQEHLFRPHLTTVINFVQLSLFGKVDPEITFDFVPLEQLSEKEEAEVEKVRADTDSVLVEAGIVDREESRQRLADDPDSPYHGLKVEDLPDLPSLGEVAGGGEGEPGGGGESNEFGQSKAPPVAGKTSVKAA
jgi:uncharacterized protein